MVAAITAFVLSTAAEAAHYGGGGNGGGGGGSSGGGSFQPQVQSAPAPGMRAGQGGESFNSGSSFGGGAGGGNGGGGGAGGLVPGTQAAMGAVGLAGDGMGAPAGPVPGSGPAGGPGIKTDAKAAASGDDSSAEAETTGVAADAVPEVTLADAAENFKTVVESYVAKNSVDGVWSYKEKKTAAKLELVSVDPSDVRAAGKGLYAGDAVMRDARTKKPRRLEFTVDMSGVKWSVVSVRSAPARAP